MANFATKNFQKAVSANAYHPDGSTVFYAGNVASNGPVTNAIGMTTAGYRSGKNGGVVPTGLTDQQIAALYAGGVEPNTGRSHVSTYKPLSAGNYAKMSLATYVVTRLATTLAGVANTSIFFGSRDKSGKSIHNTSRIRTTFLSGYKWDSGSNGPTYTRTLSNRNALSNDFGLDTIPSRTIPMELQFMYGAKDAKQENYSLPNA